MQKNYLNFERGEIVILKLPFTDLIRKKLRPVLVINNKNLSNLSKDIIVLKISSQRQLHKYEVKIDKEDLESGKIKKASYIHCHSIFTVEKALIFAKAGKINPKKLEEVIKILNKIFVD